MSIYCFLFHFTLTNYHESVGYSPDVHYPFSQSSKDKYYQCQPHLAAVLRYIFNVLQLNFLPYMCKKYG